MKESLYPNIGIGWVGAYSAVWVGNQISYVQKEN